MSMIAWLHRHYNCRYILFVNDLLMAVDPLRDCFVPINKHGRRVVGGKAYRRSACGDDPVVIYPADLVSRLGDDGKIADLEWRKMVVNKAIERRDIVPVHFAGKIPLVLPLGVGACGWA